MADDKKASRKFSFKKKKKEDEEDEDYDPLGGDPFFLKNVTPSPKAQKRLTKGTISSGSGEDLRKNINWNINKERSSSTGSLNSAPMKDGSMDSDGAPHDPAPPTMTPPASSDEEIKHAPKLEKRFTVFGLLRKDLWNDASKSTSTSTGAAAPSDASLASAIKMLKGQADGEVKGKSATLIRLLEEDEPVDFVLEEIIPLLKAYPDNFELVQACLWAIKYHTDKEGLQMLFRSFGGFPVLVDKLLSCNNDESRIAAFRFVGDALVRGETKENRENAKAFVSAGGLTYVVKYLASTNQNIRHVVSSVLVVLASFAEPNPPSLFFKRDLVKLGVIDVLNEMLKEGESHPVLRQAGLAVGLLSKGQPEIQSKVVESGTIDKLFNLLSIHATNAESGLVTEGILTGLSGIIYKNPEYQKKVLDEKGVGSLFLLMKSSSPRAQAGAAIYIGALSSANVEVKKLLKDSEILTVIMDMLKSTDNGVLENTFLAAAELLNNCPENIAAAAEFDFFGVCVSKLKSTSSYKVKAAILKAIAVLLDNDESLATMLLKAECVPLLLKLLGPEEILPVRQRASTVIYTAAHEKSVRQAYLECGGLPTLLIWLKVCIKNRLLGQLPEILDLFSTLFGDWSKVSVSLSKDTSTVQYLVNLLDQKVNSEILCLNLTCINFFVSKSENPNATQSLLEKYKVSQKVVALLAHSDSAVREKATSSIIVLSAKNSKLQSAFNKTTVFDALVRQLEEPKDGSAVLVEKTCLALRTLCHHSNSNKKAFVENRGISVLSKLVSAATTPLPVYVWAARLIASVVNEKSSLQQEASASMQDLVKNLENESLEKATASAYALHGICNKNVKSCDMFAEYNGVDKLVTLSKKAFGQIQTDDLSRQVLSVCVSLLTTVCRGQNARKDISDSGILKDLEPLKENAWIATEISQLKSAVENKGTLRFFRKK